MQACTGRKSGAALALIPEGCDVDLAEVTKALGAVPAAALRDVLVFIHICRNDFGDSTPAENLISALVASYGELGGGLTPCDVQGPMEAFCENWPNAIEDARRLARQYPWLFDTDTASAA